MRKRRAFTLIELVSAVAALAVMVALAGVVFQHAVEGYRKTKANAEILQKYVTITQQLHDDFSGLVVDMPARVVFSKGNKNIILDRDESSERRIDAEIDSIIFFATGDFQTTQTYNVGSGSDKPIKGNSALIQYCIEKNTSTSGDPCDPNSQALLRRQIVLTADDDPTGEENVAENLDDLTDENKPAYEALIGSVSEILADSQTPSYFDVSGASIASQLEFDPDSYSDHIPNLLATGVYDFKIKLIVDDSWIGSGYKWLGQKEYGNTEMYFPRNLFSDIIGGTDIIRPSAIKFTFRICDSGGVVEEYDYVAEELKPGRVFTYIIPIKDNLVGSVQ